MKIEALSMIRFNGVVVRTEGETYVQVSVLMNPEREERRCYHYEVPIGHVLTINSMTVDNEELMSIGKASEMAAFDAIDKARRS